MTQKVVLAMKAAEALPRIKPSRYPQPFASRMRGRVKRPLGDLFGLKNFGVNLTCLAPGTVSALLHQHSRQDEFVFVLEGELTLVTDQGETLVTAGMCAGFPAKGLAHQLVNRSSRDALYLEIGDRTKGDRIFYPVDDLQGEMTRAGTWRFTHKDGTPYDRLENRADTRRCNSPFFNDVKRLKIKLVCSHETGTVSLLRLCEGLQRAMQRLKVRP